MTIDIPTETLRELVQHPNELQREVIIAMYQAGHLMNGKARETLGVDIRTWDGIRKARSLRGAYSVEDLKEDIQTLKELGRL